jgi:hypothetical protein
MKFNPPNGLLRLELTLGHRRERNVQGFADLEQARCADAVSAALILLNLLKRDAQQFTEALLAHVDCAPAFAHPSPIYGRRRSRPSETLFFALLFSSGR